MVAFARVCDRLAALHSNFRNEFRSACSHCQGAGGDCLLLLLQAALEPEDAEPDADAPPAPMGGSG